MFSIRISLISLLFCCTLQLNAQYTIQEVKKSAIADARNFKLGKAELKVFRKSGRNSNSDFFKPTASTSKHAELLTDSTYVKTYREETYQKTMRRHTVGHYFLLGGISIVGAVTIIFVALS